MLICRLFFGIGVSILLIGCYENMMQSAHARGVKSYRVSLVQLLANPEKYDGSRVAVSGYLIEDGGWLNLYLTKEERLMWNQASAITIDDTTPNRVIASNMDCIETYASVIGIFSRIKLADRLGISSIQYVTRWEFNDGKSKSIPCWSHDMKQESKKKAK